MSEDYLQADVNMQQSGADQLKDKFGLILKLQQLQSSQEENPLSAFLLYQQLQALCNVQRPKPNCEAQKQDDIACANTHTSLKDPTQDNQVHQKYQFQQQQQQQHQQKQQQFPQQVHRSQYPQQQWNNPLKNNKQKETESMLGKKTQDIQAQSQDDNKPNQKQSMQILIKKGNIFLNKTSGNIETQNQVYERKPSNKADVDNSNKKFCAQETQDSKQNGQQANKVDNNENFAVDTLCKIKQDAQRNTNSQFSEGNQLSSTPRNEQSDALAEQHHQPRDAFQQKQPGWSPQVASNIQQALQAAVANSQGDLQNVFSGFSQPFQGFESQAQNPNAEKGFQTLSQPFQEDKSASTQFLYKIVQQQMKHSNHLQLSQSDLQQSLLQLSQTSLLNDSNISSQMKFDMNNLTHSPTQPNNPADSNQNVSHSNMQKNFQLLMATLQNNAGQMPSNNLDVDMNAAPKFTPPPPSQTPPKNEGTPSAWANKQLLQQLVGMQAEPDLQKLASNYSNTQGAGFKQEEFGQSQTQNTQYNPFEPQLPYSQPDIQGMINHLLSQQQQTSDLSSKADKGSVNYAELLKILNQQTQDDREMAPAELAAKKEEVRPADLLTSRNTLTEYIQQIKGQTEKSNDLAKVKDWALLESSDKELHQNPKPMLPLAQKQGDHSPFQTHSSLQAQGSARYQVPSNSIGHQSGSLRMQEASNPPFLDSLGTEQLIKHCKKILNSGGVSVEVYINLLDLVQNLGIAQAIAKNRSLHTLDSNTYSSKKSHPSDETPPQPFYPSSSLLHQVTSAYEGSKQKPAKDEINSGAPGLRKEPLANLSSSDLGPTSAQIYQRLIQQGPEGRTDGGLADSSIGSMKAFRQTSQQEQENQLKQERMAQLQRYLSDLREEGESQSDVLQKMFKIFQQNSQRDQGRGVERTLLEQSQDFEQAADVEQKKLEVLQELQRQQQQQQQQHHPGHGQPFKEKLMQYEQEKLAKQLKQMAKVGPQNYSAQQAQLQKLQDVQEGSKPHASSMQKEFVQYLHKLADKHAVQQSTTAEKALGGSWSQGNPLKADTPNPGQSEGPGDKTKNEAHQDSLQYLYILQALQARATDPKQQLLIGDLPQKAREIQAKLQQAQQHSQKSKLIEAPKGPAFQLQKQESQSRTTPQATSHAVSQQAPPQPPAQAQYSQPAKQPAGSQAQSTLEQQLQCGSAKNSFIIYKTRHEGEKEAQPGNFMFHIDNKSKSFHLNNNRDVDRMQALEDPALTQSQPNLALGRQGEHEGMGNIRGSKGLQKLGGKAQPPPLSFEGAGGQKNGQGHMTASLKGRTPQQLLLQKQNYKFIVHKRSNGNGQNGSSNKTSNQSNQASNVPPPPSQSQGLGGRDEVKQPVKAQDDQLNLNPMEGLHFGGKHQTSVGSVKGFDVVRQLSGRQFPGVPFNVPNHHVNNNSISLLQQGGQDLDMFQQQSVNFNRQVSQKQPKGSPVDTTKKLAHQRSLHEGSKGQMQAPPKPLFGKAEETQGPGQDQSQQHEDDDRQSYSAETESLAEEEAEEATPKEQAGPSSEALPERETRDLAPPRGKEEGTPVASPATAQNTAKGKTEREQRSPLSKSSRGSKKEEARLSAPPDTPRPLQSGGYFMKRYPQLRDYISHGKEHMEGQDVSAYLRENIKLVDQLTDNFLHGNKSRIYFGAVDLGRLKGVPSEEQKQLSSELRQKTLQYMGLQMQNAERKGENIDIFKHLQQCRTKVGQTLSGIQKDKFVQTQSITKVWDQQRFVQLRQQNRYRKNAGKRRMDKLLTQITNKQTRKSSPQLSQSLIIKDIQQTKSEPLKINKNHYSSCTINNSHSPHFHSQLTSSHSLASLQQLFQGSLEREGGDPDVIKELLGPFKQLVKRNPRTVMEGIRARRQLRQQYKRQCLELKNQSQSLEKERELKLQKQQQQQQQQLQKGQPLEQDMSYGSNIPQSHQQTSQYTVSNKQSKQSRERSMSFKGPPPAQRRKGTSALDVGQTTPSEGGLENVSRCVSPALSQLSRVNNHGTLVFNASQKRGREKGEFSKGTIPSDKSSMAYFQHCNSVHGNQFSSVGKRSKLKEDKHYVEIELQEDLDAQMVDYTADQNPEDIDIDDDEVSRYQYTKHQGLPKNEVHSDIEEC